MYQWLFGLPVEITGHAHIGKYHDIEVEDEVTAYFEHEDGMIGHLIVTTAESPGTNRLEIVGEYGKLVFEKNKLVFNRNRISTLKHLKETKERFGTVEQWQTEITVKSNVPTGHKVVAEKFVQAVLDGQGELVAHGTEGIRSVTLANGIMLSSFNKATVQVPFDTDAYESKLQELIRTSKYVKHSLEAAAAAEDISTSFSTK
jgi:predicted dehydrogenase